MWMVLIYDVKSNKDDV